MKIAMIILCLILVGCGSGDRLAFSEPRSASINENLLCINAKNGDVISFYSLSSSIDNYSNTIMHSGDQEKSRIYPNLCFDIQLKRGFNYSLLYVLNEKKYRLEFNIDLNGTVTNITR